MDLSIVVATYNHENYVEKAMQSILKQKISYSYEVWIGDDASSDNTQVILKSIQDCFPDNFHFILREKNIGADANFNDLYRRTRGRYLIVLEGDDYWINPHKLQNQIQFLETHPDYIAVAHNVIVVDAKDKVRTDYNYPECKKKEYDLYEFRNNRLAGQTATIMSRNYYTQQLFDFFNPSVSWPGDRTRNFLFASYGKVFCFQKQWSAYRYVIEKGSSYSANFKKNTETEKRLLQYHKELYLYAKTIVKSKKSIIVAESMYLYLLLMVILRKKIPGIVMKEWLNEFKRANYKAKCLVYILLKLLKVYS